MSRLVGKAKLKNRRIAIQRFEDKDGILVNCYTFKRLKPDRSILRSHIHLTDEALRAMIELRNDYDQKERELNHG